MPQRRFIIASAFARLIRKENGVVSRVVEGYFPDRPDREHFVRIEPGRCDLVLGAAREGAGGEERTEVPRSQADALMTVCAGKVGFECTKVRLSEGTEAQLKHFVAPGRLDLLSIEFDEDTDAEAFAPYAWFGPEVTQDAAYDTGSLARVGVPSLEQTPLSNAMLEELLDTLEEALTAAQLGRAPAQQPRDASPAHGPTGSEPDQLSPAPVEPAPRPHQIAELAKPLEGFRTPTSPRQKQATVEALPPRGEPPRGSDRVSFGVPARRLT
jgi:CYTH domain-containing protein